VENHCLNALEHFALLTGKQLSTGIQVEKDGTDLKLGA